MNVIQIAKSQAFLTPFPNYYVESEFKDGLFVVGKSKTNDQNGDIYEGEMKEKMRHGKGTVTKMTGEICETQFENDQMIYFKNLVKS